MARTKDRPPKHRLRLVRNHSSRNGAPINAIAVHSTEGVDIPNSLRDLDALYNWFNNPASQASSHIGVDGDGNIDVYVMRDKKAWTILQLNSLTWNIEFVAKAAQSSGAWEERQIKNAAKYAAYVCLKEGIPAQRGTVKVVSGWPVIGRKGIIRHSDLTNAGFGSHTDPGANFPMREFIDAVRFYKKNGWEV
jgi:N-acetyl-anhydromuramyl-L-alanine amidase AmpD